MPKLTFQSNSVPKLTLGAEVHRLVPKLFRAEVTRAEHQLSGQNNSQSYSIDDFNQSNPAGAAISKRYQLLLILYSMMPVWVLNKKLYPKKDDFYLNP